MNNILLLINWYIKLYHIQNLVSLWRFLLQKNADFLTLCVPMRYIYVMASAYRVPRGFCSECQSRIYTSWKWHSSGHGEWPREFIKNRIMLYASRKKTFLFENNIIKKRSTVKNLSLISTLYFNTFVNLQNFHFEWNFSNRGAGHKHGWVGQFLHW